MSIFKNITAATTEFTEEQEDFIEELYQEGLKEVFGEDSHGRYPEVDNDKVKAAAIKFIDTYLKEEGETFTVEVCTSPLDARKKAKGLAKDEKNMVVLSYPWLSDWRFIKMADCLKEFDDLSAEEKSCIKTSGEYAEILRSGIFDITVAHGDNENEMTAFVAPTFSYVNTDEEGRLHSTEGPAVSWRDGYREFAIMGIFFDESIWKRIVNKELTAEEITSWPNADEKAAILSVYGAEWLIEQYNAEVVDTWSFDKSKAEDGKFYLPFENSDYTLYKVEGVFPDTEYFIGYADPSTGRKYFENVPPEEAEKGALASISWKFHTEPADFANMEYHA